MKIQVRLNNYRRSARKVREIIPVIKGLGVMDALRQLEFLQKGGAYDLRKLLLSAVATAENDFGLKKNELIVKNVMVQEGKTLKRWRARAYGRANQILKRTCHILLTVALRDDNKDDKQEAQKNDKRVIGKDVVDVKKKGSADNSKKQGKTGLKEVVANDKDNK